ncbi:DUF4214 domain-containing protein [Marinobacter sp. CA1]|uniref:DUF4214 domain-containing protein n=1 Tax=Marinobacter sp. CA1 TaxID=2817656 RepID=UPI001D08885B|nr:DUF4214 domain-containing protein [Marinobacter sp. CA1]UDL03832.1 DUF4214 domain-containing protein [Marinobacter sp. CA1]
MLSSRLDPQFSHPELSLIRTFIALTGKPPTQTQLEFSFGFYDLWSRAQDLAKCSAGMGRDEFVTQLYQNLLNRAPDAEGLAYWSSLLASGSDSLDQATLAVHFQHSAAMNANQEPGLVVDTDWLYPTRLDYGDIAVDPGPGLGDVKVFQAGQQVVDLADYRNLDDRVGLSFSGCDHENQVTILNFVQDSDGEAGSDRSDLNYLNFLDYLTSETLLPGGEGRVEFMQVEFESSASSLKGNTVSIVTFQGAGESDSQTWDNLAADDLVALLNGVAGYGDAANLVVFDAYDADNDALGDGFASNHIFMVENDSNAGEYKLFHVTSTGMAENETGDFDARAHKIGVVDFGSALSTNEFDMEDSLMGSSSW